MQEYLSQLWTKLSGLLKSRKFWALVTACLAVAQAHALGQITDWQSIQALVAALSAYSLGTAIEDHGAVSVPAIEIRPDTQR